MADHFVARLNRLAGRRGATALEFALVAVPFLTLILGTMEVGYDLFVQAVLDAAVEHAARGVQTGSQQGTSGESGGNFAAAAICPAISGLLDCTELVVAVAPVPSGSNYANNPNLLTLAKALSGTICTGTGGQMMLIEAWYLGPTLVGVLIPQFSTAYGVTIVHITTSTAGFVNEYFTGGQSSGAGC